MLQDCAVEQGFEEARSNSAILPWVGTEGGRGEGGVHRWRCAGGALGHRGGLGLGAGEDRWQVCWRRRGFRRGRGRFCG